MKILVTGGAGFIASHITNAYISNGHNVFIVDNLSTGNMSNIDPKATFIKMDVTSTDIYNLLDRERFDVINHHAAQMNVRFSVEEPNEDARININGGLNIYEAARKTGVKKVIFASSGGAIYGDTENVPTPENAPLEPCSPYGIAKMANEKYLAFYKQTYGMDFVALRYANIYGPRQNAKGEAGVIAIFTSKMLSGEQPVINGDGETMRDYVFVKDVVNANLLALQHNMSGVYNIGTEIQTSTNQIFNNLRILTGTDTKEVHGKPMPGEQRISCISHSKITKEFGWKPQVSLMEGLQQTVAYFKNR